jgi:hypothetical protein
LPVTAALVDPLSLYFFILFAFRPIFAAAEDFLYFRSIVACMVCCYINTIVGCKTENTKELSGATHTWKNKKILKKV